MSPMIKRIAKGIGYGLCPFLKLLPIAGILTSTILLIDTVGTHSTPLIVVATQPKFCDALETVVISYHLWYQMTMIIDNRHLCRIVVIQILSNLGLQDEILVVESFHKYDLFLSCI